MIENAKWIWADCKYSVNQYTDFLLEFEIDKADTGAMLEISADSEYVVWLNGTYVGCGQYDDYPQNKSYDAYAIGAILKEGKNRLEVWGYYQGGKSLQYSSGINALCFALNNFDDVYLSDENVLATVNSKYKSGEIFKTTAQLGYGFMHDANTENAEFEPAVVKSFDTQFMPRPIKRTEIADEIPAKIIAQGYFMRADKEEENIALRMHTDFLSHRKFDDMFYGKPELPGCAELVRMQHDGAYIIVDLGREESGYLTIDLCADKGALIEMGYGEHLDDMRVRTVIKSRQFANSYIAKGENDRFTYYFRRIAGRYLQLHISKTEKLRINYVGVKPCFYPVTEKGYFKCNDSLHNKIYEVCINTLKQCMHEHYEDCPWREQALYASDSRNQILCGYYAFDDIDFAKASIALLGESFDDDGYQRICAPTDEKLKILSFALIWFLEIAEYTEFTGDDYFVKNTWAKMEKALSLFVKDDIEPPEGDNYWNFYEWSEGYENDTPPKKKERLAHGDFSDGIYKVFVCLAIKSMLSLAQKYGKTAFTEKYMPILENLKHTINDKFWDSERGMYSSYYYAGKKQHYGELMQVMAMYAGVAEGKEEQLCELITNPENDLVKITLSYSLYKYEVLLSRGGKYDKFVFDEIAEVWGRMLYKGATSFWETVGGADDFILAGSLCHGWSAFPLYLYYRYILGITPEMLRGESKIRQSRRVFAEYEGRCGDIKVVKREGEVNDYTE